MTRYPRRPICTRAGTPGHSWGALYARLTVLPATGLCGRRQKVATRVLPASTLNGNDVVGRSLSIPEPKPVGRSLRGIGLVSGSPRWPNLARHFPAGRAFVRDKTGLSSERRDPHDLPHRSMTTGAGNPTSSFRNVRHRLTRQTHSFRVNSPPIQRFPFERNFRAYDQPCRSGTTCKARASLSRWPW